MAYDSEGGKDHDVDFRVSEEPEEVLEENGVTTLFWDEECCTEVSVCKEHGDGSCEYGKRDDEEESGNEHGPAEEGHFVEGHSGGTHIEDGGDEVDGTEQ